MGNILNDKFQITGLRHRLRDDKESSSFFQMNIITIARRRSHIRSVAPMAFSLQGTAAMGNESGMVLWLLRMF